MSRRWELGLLAGIFVLAAILRVTVAGQSGLWVDEIFSLALATGHSLEQPADIAQPALGDFVESDHAVSLDQFRRYLKHDDPPAGPRRVVRAVLLSDTSPPLYYLLLWGWTLLFGTSDFGLRSFSIACSLACLPLLASVGRRVGGAGTAVASCTLFAFSPPCVFYSTEGRMYSLLWLCVLALLWASIALHRKGGGVGLSALWVAASGAGFLTHYFFVFPWVATVGWLVLRPGRLSRLRLVGCLLATGLVISFWYIRLPESLAGWRVTMNWQKGEPAGFNRLASARELALQFFRTDGPRSMKIALLAFGIVGVLLLWRMRRRPFAWRRLLLWLAFAAACMGPLVFDLIQHTCTAAVRRYAMAALPPAYLLAGLGFATLRLPVRSILLALVLIAWKPELLSMSRDRNPGPAIQKVARAASERSGPSDLILVHSIPSGALGVARYATGSAAFAPWVGQLGKRRVPESIEQLARGRKRILFVSVHEVGADAPEEQWLRMHAIVARDVQLPYGRFVEFRPRAAETF